MRRKMFRVKCQRCGGPLDVTVNEQYAAGGHLIGRLIQTIRCLGHGCRGDDLLSDADRAQITRV
jgi:hypothetical protein